MTNRKIEYWVIPPEADGEFVAHMEEVLETYEKRYNPNVPVLCMDEQPVQLLKETRSPIPATAKHAKRVDYEYERAGRPPFLCSPNLWLAGVVTVRERKTKIDWAVEMAGLLEGRYAACAKVILVCDNLNTHTKGAFYEAFEPERLGSDDGTNIRHKLFAVIDRTKLSINPGSTPMRKLQGPRPIFVACGPTVANVSVLRLGLRSVESQPFRLDENWGVDISRGVARG